LVTRDISKSFTIEQLKQQYNLDSRGLKKAIESSNHKMIKIENELQNIVATFILNLKDEFENQSDISLWFFNGHPTVENSPFIGWENPEEHVGDLYFDRETGKVYKYNSSGWVLQNNKELAHAMALTNIEIDIKDNERKVFFSNPTPPYESGDWWIKEDGTLFICQIGKPAGIYEENDFIIFNEYQDAIAVKIDNELKILGGKITTIERGIDEISTSVEENKYFVDEDGNKQLISEEMSSIIQNLDGIEMLTSNLETTLGDNYYQKQDIEQLILNAESGLTNIFSTSGGNNLLRNTAPWYGEDLKWDYWEGNLARIQESDSSTNYAFSLQNGIVKQTIQLADGYYSISFKYKKILDVANAKVRYNNNEIILEDEGTIQTTGLINTKYFSFEMECDTDGGYEIYELMLNHGEAVYLPWSQNQNEIKTTNINISEDITAESNIEDTRTTLGAKGLVGTNKTSNEIVFKQTKDGSYSKNVEANKGTIARLSISEVGNQTWMVRV